jgi:hypothetical protein
MQLSILLALGAVPALVVYVVISAVIRQWRFARRARKLHCLPPPTLPSPDPFGIGLILQILESDRKKRMPDYIRDMQNVVSKQEGRAVSTFQLRRPIRKYDYFTTDPKNIQAILALQFKEFGVGDARTGNFEPLLGRGIVSISCDLDLGSLPRTMVLLFCLT